MTQNTEQERAEFEAWAAKNYHSINLEHEGRSYRYFLANKWWTAWQAARRAQVVPKGMALVPLIPTKQQLSVAQGYGLTRHQLRGIYAAFTAAAPQPPEAGCSVSNAETEAAPVKLPEPDINTANHAGIRVIGYSPDAVRALLAGRAKQGGV